MSKDIKIANDAISVTNALIKVGTSLVNDKELHKQILANLGTIVACGELVKVILNLCDPGKPDPVMEKLQQLEKKLEQLSEKISNQFDELKAFVCEHHFYAEIAQTASTLTKYLEDTLTNPSHHTMGLFRDICQRQPPLQYAYKMISLLEQEATNPLKMAMKADTLKKRFTFNKWKNIFNDILSQFLYLECMVNGMFWNKNMIGPNQLAKRIADFNGRMEEWSNQYKKSYWPDTITAVVHDTQDKYPHLGNSAKADILRDKIGEILTDDAFYIIVYNHCGSFEQHSYNITPSQFIDSYRREGCNVIVYRSRHMNGHRQPKEDLDRMEREVESCRHDTIPCRTEFKGFPGELMKNRIGNAGFVGMIRDGHDPEFRDVNSWRKWGPGWWIKAHVSLHQRPGWRDGKIPAFYLIAGYK